MSVRLCATGLLLWLSIMLLPASDHSVPLAAATAQSDAGDAQYRAWISEAPRSLPVHAAPNGINFFPGYRDWKAISSTDRTDTNTLKLILGNDVAVRAIREHTINPWPDGTVLAKVSWMQDSAQDGLVRTGQFDQVAFMVKNSAQYAATDGWGWAQWLGLELKPYGGNVDPARECVVCHRPLRGSDFVFTTPIPAAGSLRVTVSNLFKTDLTIVQAVDLAGVSRPDASRNLDAALVGNIPANPMNWRAITVGVDRHNGTMFTLFGNDAALEYARTNNGHGYPAGSIIALVTWRQQVDTRWLGGKIPAQPKTLEFLAIQPRLDRGPLWRYCAYDGSPLKQRTTTNNHASRRIESILALRAAVMP